MMFDTLPRLARRLASLLLAASAAASVLASPAAAESPDLSGVTLKVGIFQEVQYLQHALTDDFKNTPYTIEWVRLNGAGGTMQALGAGAIDLSWGLSDVALPNASALDVTPWTAEDAPLKHIALLAPFDAAAYPSHVLVASSKSGITALDQIKGHSFTYQEGGNSAAAALLALKSVGLTIKDIEPVLIPADSIPAAVISGAVDVATVQWAQIQEALDDGTVKRLASSYEVGFPGYTSITARTGAIEDPKLSAAIGDFLTRATAFSIWRAAHLDEIAKTYVEAQQLNEDQAKRAAASIATRIVPLVAGGDAVKLETDLQEALFSSGFLARKVDYAPLYDDRFKDAILAGEALAAKK